MFLFYQVLSFQNLLRIPISAHCIFETTTSSIFNSPTYSRLAQQNFIPPFDMNNNQSMKSIVLKTESEKFKVHHLSYKYISYLNISNDLLFD